LQNPTSTLLDDLHTHGTRRQIAPTMAGAHTAHTTTTQHQALRTAQLHGLVARRGPAGASVATLRAIARKGLAQLHMVPGGRPHEISHATLTAAGRRELDRLDQAATQQQTLRMLAGHLV